MQDAIRGNDTPLNVHSDDFNGALGHGGGYRNVYYKTATMLHNLQYVLGDELFLKAMKFYFNRWRICHPYTEDFRQAIIDAAGTDLNWFFDQWIETTKAIDYKLGKIKKKKNNYSITFIRKGEMQMPIDFRVVSKNDSVYDFHIPNTWFVKQTKATVLPKWYGWGKIQPEYTALINVPGGVKSVSIDPSGRLADIDQRNNQSGSHSRFSFDSRVANAADRFYQEWVARPDLWWNHFDGLKAGAHVESHYLNYKNIFSASAWFNFGLGQTIDSNKTPITAYNNFSYRLSYSTPINQISKRTRFFMDSRFLDGLHMHSAGLESRSHTEKTRFYSYIKGMERPREEDLLYLIQRNLWKSNQLNLTINTGFDHRYTHAHGTGNIMMNLRSAVPYSDVNYSQLSFTVINRNIWGKFDFNTRTFVQLGFGDIPLESALYTAGGNPEQWMDSKYTRSAGMIPGAWTAIGDVTNYWHQPGGLNLRGYSGYLLPFTNANGLQENAFYVPSGASVNLELAFDRLIPIKMRRLRNIFDYDLYLFGDAGLLNIMNLKSTFPSSTAWTDALRADAGFGTSITLKKFGPNLMIDPLTIRADFPVYLSNAPFMEIGNIAPRWMLSLSKSF
jgi:aminopeptidase N